MSNSPPRIGVILFVGYSLFYLGFVLLAAFAPASMEVLPLAGVNLAIWYGFALILLAFILALAYGWVRRAPPPEDDSHRGPSGGPP